VAILERRAVRLPIVATDDVDVGDVVGECPVLVGPEPVHLACADGERGRLRRDLAGERDRWGRDDSRPDAVEEPTGDRRRHHDDGTIWQA
jgi:hypothetical protein